MLPNSGRTLRTKFWRQEKSRQNREFQSEALLVARALLCFQTPPHVLFQKIDTNLERGAAVEVIQRKKCKHITNKINKKFKILIIQQKFN